MTLRTGKLAPFAHPQARGDHSSPVAKVQWFWLLRNSAKKQQLAGMFAAEIVKPLNSGNCPLGSVKFVVDPEAAKATAAAFLHALVNMERPSHVK
jgi:hypothetical protein